MVHCTTLRHITLHYATLGWIGLDYIKVHYLAFFSTLLCCTLHPLHHITSLCVKHTTPHYITSYHIPLLCVALKKSCKYTQSRWELKREIYRIFSLAPTAVGTRREGKPYHGSLQLVFTPAAKSALAAASVTGLRLPLGSVNPSDFAPMRFLCNGCRNEKEPEKFYQKEG